MGWLQDLGRAAAVGVKYGTPGQLGETWSNNVLDPGVDVYGTPRAGNYSAQNPAPNAGSGQYATGRQPAGKIEGNVLGNNTGSGSTGGGSEPAYSPEDLAFLDFQAGLLREMLGRTDTTLSQGLTNLDDSFNREQSRSNERQSQVLRDYGIRRDDTTRDQQGALGRVDTNARTLSESIRRMLGMASGRGSHNDVANFAIARQASDQRSGVKDKFGRNLRDIDVAETDAKSQFEQLLEDLAIQRRSKESELRGGVEDRRIDIERGLADIAGERAALTGGGYAGARLAQQPYLDSIRSRQSQLDGLFERFRSPQYNVKQVDPKVPQLAEYTVDRQKLNANQQLGSDPNSPYAQFLAQRQREDDERYV